MRPGFPPFDAVFSLFRYAAISHRPTASAADRAVPVELRRLLAVIHATATPPCGRCPRSTSRRSSSTPLRSRPCGGRSKPWSGRSRSSAGKRHTWPGTTGRSPRRCAGAGADAPAGARAGSGSEPLIWFQAAELAGARSASYGSRLSPARYAAQSSMSRGLWSKPRPYRDGRRDAPLRLYSPTRPESGVRHGV